jgi:SulP family sulfate permease
LQSLRLLRSRSTILDFAVIVAVVITALRGNLIDASLMGIRLAILLFLYEQINGAVVRSKTYGNQTFSKQVRLPEEMAVLERRGDSCVILELQGSLFFGTSDRLYTTIEPELKNRRYAIVDLGRVRSIDYTAARLLGQIGGLLGQHGGELILTQSRRKAPGGQDLERYLRGTGLAGSAPLVFFDMLNDAQEYVEERILDEARLERSEQQLLNLREVALFRGRKTETIAALEQCLDHRKLAAGERIFAKGDSGDELFIIRRGSVRIVLPLGGQQKLHLATFGRGDFFGEMAFLDREPRSADAVALSESDLYVLSRDRFDALSADHRLLGMNLLEGLARTLAYRLRRANKELLAFHETGEEHPSATAK